MSSKPTRRCPNQHRNCWVLGCTWLWCPDCGAHQLNKPGRTLWIYPDGQEAALARSDAQRRMDAKAEEQAS